MNEAHQQHEHVDGSIELSPPPCDDSSDGETCGLIDGRCKERSDEAHLATFDGSCADERISQPVHCRRLYLAISSALLATAAVYLITNHIVIPFWDTKTLTFNPQHRISITIRRRQCLKPTLPFQPRLSWASPKMTCKLMLQLMRHTIHSTISNTERITFEHCSIGKN